MNFVIPESMPARSDFLTAFLDAIFPDLDISKSKKGPYAYTAACEQATKELGIPYSENGDCDDMVDINGNLFRLMFELNNISKEIFNKESTLISQEEFKSYSGTLFTFCSQSSGSLKVWLKQTSPTNRINKSFDAALFFTYLLLSRDIAEKTRVDFFKYCLGCIGISDIEASVEHKLYNSTGMNSGQKIPSEDWDLTVSKTRQLLCSELPC